MSASINTTARSTGHKSTSTGIPVLAVTALAAGATCIASIAIVAIAALILRFWVVIAVSVVAAATAFVAGRRAGRLDAAAPLERVLADFSLLRTAVAELEAAAGNVPLESITETFRQIHPRYRAGSRRQA